MEALRKRLFKSFGGDKVETKPLETVDQKQSCGTLHKDVLTSLLLHGCEVERKVLVAPAQDVTLCAMELSVSLG